ncbi:hypothetical protein [Streptomyces sp. NPDC006134]|uniref:hypothetical protein n=1 Tax=Streptomyces sp. NPDC006134 TaxID=3154467 RepID=UPI0033FAE932
MAPAPGRPGKRPLSADQTDALSRLVLLVVPTLDLAAQTAPAWRRDGHGEHMAIVSSPDPEATGHDDLVAVRVVSATGPARRPHWCRREMTATHCDGSRVTSLTGARPLRGPPLGKPT